MNGELSPPDVERWFIFRVHTGWKMERIDKHQDTNEVHDSAQGPTSVSTNQDAKLVEICRGAPNSRTDLSH